MAGEEDDEAGSDERGGVEGDDRKANQVKTISSADTDNAFA